MTVAATATRFAWGVLGAPDYPPPVPRRGPRFAAAAACWLCGGPTDGQGWPLRTAIADTFTNHNAAACPTSDALCQPCAYLSRGDTWAAYAAAHPALGLKAVHPLSWRSYSHVFAADGTHACPTRATWRAWLLAPPPPPFLFVVAESGQKHLLYRAAVAHDRDRYPLQIEEQRLLVERAALAACLQDVEALLAAGASRAGVETGRYHPAALARMGLGAWRALEAAVRPWRQRAPDLLHLAALVAHSPGREEAAGSP